MPGWNPPPELRFDHEAATAALVEIRRTQELLAGLLDTQASVIDAAAARWRGRARDRADDLLGLHRSSLKEVVDHLDQLARQLRVAAATAVAEHHRRDRLRRQWLGEVAEERGLSLGAFEP